MPKKKFPMTKVFNGRRYKYHSNHNSERTAKDEVNRIKDAQNGRIVKRRQPERSRFEWTWIVYTASKKNMPRKKA